MPAPALIAAARVTVGGLVHLLIRDGSGNPAFVTALNSHPSLTVTPAGGPAGAPVVVADVVTSDFDAQTLVDYVLLRPATPILDTDGLTVSAAAGWIAVAAGAAQAESGVPVTNGPAAGRSLLPDRPAGPVTMPVGTNGGGPVPNSPGLITSNLCGHAGDWSGNLNHPDFVVDVATGLPTSVGTNTALNCLLTFPSSSPDGKNVLNCPPSAGPDDWFVIEWDSRDGATAATPMWLGNMGGGTTTPDTAGWEITGQVTGNRRRFLLGGTPPARGLFVGMGCSGDGSGRVNVGNVRAYRPGVDPANPGDFDPDHLRQLADVPVIRDMDTESINQAGTVHFVDYPTVGQMGFGRQNTYLRPSQVASIGPYTDAAGWFAKQGVPFLVTCTAPHGIGEGETVQMLGFDTSGPNADGTIPVTGGVDPITGADAADDTINLAQFGGYVFLARVAGLASDQLAGCHSPDSTGVKAGQRVAGTYAIAPGPYVGRLGKQGLPPLLTVRRANACRNGAGADHYVHLPHCGTDDCWTQRATVEAENLKAGRTAIFALGNENWNGRLGSQYKWFISKGQVFTLGSGGALNVSGLDSSGYPVIGSFSAGSGYTAPIGVHAVGGIKTSNPAAATYGLALTDGAGHLTGEVAWDYRDTFSAPPTLALGTISNIHAYVYEFSRMAGLVRAAFAAAGRPDDCKFALETQGSFPNGVGYQLIWYASLLKQCDPTFSFDYLSVAPYCFNGPGGAASAAVNDRMSHDQRFDCLEAFTLSTQGQIPVMFGPHRQLLTNTLAGSPLPGVVGSPWPAVKMAVYEQAFEYLGLPSAVSQATSDLWSRQIGRDPRLQAAVLPYFYGQLQAAGAALVCDYFLLGHPGDDLGGRSNANWPSYFSFGMPAGPGDGTGTSGFVNRTDVDDLTHIDAVKAYAIARWNAQIAAGGAVPRPRLARWRGPRPGPPWWGR